MSPITCRNAVSPLFPHVSSDRRGVRNVSDYGTILTDGRCTSETASTFGHPVSRLQLEIRVKICLSSISDTIVISITCRNFSQRSSVPLSRRVTDFLTTVPVIRFSLPFPETISSLVSLHYFRQECTFGFVTGCQERRLVTTPSSSR